MTTISLELPDALVSRVDRAAKERKLTKATFIRAMLEKALESTPDRAPASCYELAKDLAGSIKGLPKDLVTNPSYMKGFGK